ncbi:hypothetical protein QR680_014442 [Steinernema hermaphroditum]|uniref:P-type domain-containing protein n=1 Tax=Steinernema hermaphroditum TaxID=289476 RepID=A0AA39IB29_9BILA|nr:hypothetical protein QR680_014442 [Steinernema hermaphroditum]
MRWSAVVLAVLLFSDVIFGDETESTPKPVPIDCYWTDCINPFDHDTCKDGFAVKKWEYCIWPWKKEYCCRQGPPPPNAIFD